MRANARPRQAATRRREDAGQVGIGTMIIFIATILTAAVAAGVVIDTSNSLQEKAQRTGSEATEQVSNNLLVTTVQGKVDSTGTKLDSLNISIVLAAGSKQVDLGQLLVRLSNGSVAKQLNYSQTGTGATFAAAALRDPDASFTAATPVITGGDLVNLNIDLTSAGANMVLGPRKTVEMTLTPEVGSRVATELRTPPSLTANAVVLMR
jgi:archaeal flagellin FlaB